MPRLPRHRFVWGVAAAVAVLGLVAGVLLTSSRGGYAPALADGSLKRLDDYGQLPPFSLVERSGRRVTLTDLLGRISVVNFIYTRCTETCPTQSLQLARLQTEFAHAADLRLVSITVDPLHDTPEILTRYAERYAADPERWLFLTGDKRAIYCLATGGFRLSAVDPADPNPPPCPTSVWSWPERALTFFTPSPVLAAHGSRGLVMHSARLVLVDRAARIRAYHLATDSESLGQMHVNLRTLLADRKEP